MTNSMTQNIWAVGRNYIDHAKEMNAAIPTEPLIFLKAGSTLNYDQKIILPLWSTDIHHEIEIALLLDDTLSISHMTLAIDLTARDKQAEAKKNGSPWTLSKSFTGACPIGPWIAIKNFNNLAFNLVINDKSIQTGFTKDMIFSIQTQLDYIKAHFPISSGDIILTGTPSGVGPLRSNDSLKATMHDTDLSTPPILTCHWNVE